LLVDVLFTRAQVTKYAVVRYLKYVIWKSVSEICVCGTIRKGCLG